MTEVNGPYIIDEFRYVRDATDREQGILLMIAAGGEQFGAPMSVSQIKALIEKLQSDLAAI